MTGIALWLRLLAWLASFLFTGILAVLLSRRLPTGRRSLDVAATLFCWIWLTTLMTFLMGLAGLLSSIPLGLVGSVGVTSIVGSRRTRKELARAWFEGKPGRDRIVQSWHAFPLWTRWLSAGFLIFGIARFGFLVWSLPPFVWDSLTYHLTNVAQWVQDGRIGLFDTAVQRIYSPANYEVLAAWFSVFLHHDVVIEAAGLPAYALAGISAYALARSLGLSSFAAWLATLAYLSTPALVFAATGTKNDPFVAAVYLFLAALIVHLRTRDSGEIQPLAPAVWLTLGATYALGTKTYILQLLPGLVLLGLTPGSRTGSWSGWRQWAGRMAGNLRAMSGRTRVFVLALVGFGILIGGYWNVRNWVLKGNPFYPYEVAVESQPLPSTGSGHYGLGLERLEANLRVLGEKFGDKQARILPDLPDTTGWGWMFYGLGLAASVWAFGVDTRFRFLTAGFVLSMLCLMGSNTTSPWNMRYFIWLPALCAIGLGMFLEPFETLRSRTNRALAALFGFGIVMNAIMTVNYNLISIEDIARMLALPVWERDAGRLHVRAPQEYESAYAFVPKDALLGYNVHENGFVYPLYRADFSQRLVFIPVTAGDSCDAIAETMEARGTRYLFVAPEHTDDHLIAKLRECAQEVSPIRERAGGLYVVKRDGG